MVRTKTKPNVEAITNATVHHYRRRPSALQEVTSQFCPRGLVLAAVLLDDHGKFLRRVIVLISSSCVICHGIHLLANLLLSSSCFPPPFVTPWRTSITVIFDIPSASFTKRTSCPSDWAPLSIVFVSDCRASLSDAHDEVHHNPRSPFLVLLRPLPL
jgi:hypothetical protein